MSEVEVIARVERRRKWTIAEKTALLAELEAEGGKVAVVARRHRISESLLYSWRSAGTSLYQEITDKIVAELESGRVPWVQPWGTAAAKASLAMPKNASTNRQYSGVNILILWGAVIERGFAGQSWLTFRQALSLGGPVRKGERGTTVVYADRFVP